MSRHLPEHDPRSEFEDEGIPDLQAGTPESQWAEDPQQAPLPTDDPQAVDDFGTTAEEQAQGEPLDLRTAREVPEDQAMFGGEGEPAGQPARPGGLEGWPGRGGASPDEDPVPEDPGAELAPDEAGEEPAAGEPAGASGLDQASESRPAGRLVAPDEGAHPHSETDAVAEEAGPDAGGYTAEEASLRVDPE
jgi:uncharacterized protein DUF5709